MFSLMLVLGLIIASALFLAVLVAAAENCQSRELDRTLAEAERAIANAVKKYKQDLERLERGR